MTASTEKIEAIRTSAQDELARRRLLDYARVMDPRFIPARHLVLVTKYLEKLERREIRKLAITMPPRHGKTRLVSQLFVSWYLGRHPDHDVILASYGSELAEGNSRAVRTLVTDDRFPFVDLDLREDSRSVGRWQTRQGATLVSVGVGSGLTGRGGSLIVPDDLIKGREEAESEAVLNSTRAWYQDVLSTRAAPDAIQVQVGTRWSEKDPLGEVVDRDGWVTLNLPLISEGKGDPLERPEGEWLWPERFSDTDIPSVERGEISSRSFASLYQQRPSPAQGSIFKREWFSNRYAALPTASPLLGGEVPPWLSPAEYGDRLRQSPIVVAGVDCASKTGMSNDFSVIATIMADGRDFYVIDIDRARLEFADLIRHVMESHWRHRQRCIYIEDASAGVQLTQELKRATGVPVVAVLPRGSKLARAESVSPLFESGRVKLPYSAPWVEEMIEEFLRFPTGRHDDIVDALCLALSQAQQIQRNRQARDFTSQHVDWMAR